jgi:hypothetical protein
MRVLSAALLFSLLSTVACASAPTPGPRPDKNNTEETPSDPSAGQSDTTHDDATPAGDPTSTPSPSGQQAAGSLPVATPVNLKWNALGNFVYSLDVKTPGGEWIGPCLDVSIIGSATSFTYKGVCTSAGGTTVAQPTGYRLYFSRSDAEVQHWQDFVEVTPTNGDVVFNLPTSAPNSVALTWNKKSDTAAYSLDIFLMNGEQIRPCVDTNTLGKTTAFSFDGSCTAGPSARHIDLKDVKDFVICSAEGGNWSTAACAGIPYTGYGTSRTIPN